MPSYRCPACGANHKEFQPQCRLCGQSLSSTTAAAPAPQVTVKSGGGRSTKGVVLLGIGVVVAVVAIALVFGLVSGNKAIDKAKDKVLPGSLQDGWSPLTDPDGGFSVNLPGDRTKASVPFTGSVDGKATTWTAKVGKDTTLTVGYTKVERPEYLTTTSALTRSAVQRFLRDFQQVKCVKTVSAPTTVSAAPSGAEPIEAACEEYATVEGYPITGLEEVSLAGMPAIKYQYKITSSSGTTSYVRVLAGLRSDQLYFIRSESVYKDVEQFDRMTESFIIG